MLDPRAVLETCSLNSWALGQEAERQSPWWLVGVGGGLFDSARRSGSRRDLGNEQDEGMLAFTLESGRTRGRPADIIKCLLDML